MSPVFPRGIEGIDIAPVGIYAIPSNNKPKGKIMVLHIVGKGAERNAHQHATSAEARFCQVDWELEEIDRRYVHDEDGQIAMMRVLETNELQRWETEREEGMIAALWD